MSGPSASDDHHPNLELPLSEDEAAVNELAADMPDLFGSTGGAPADAAAENAGADDNESSSDSESSRSSEGGQSAAESEAEEEQQDDAAEEK